VKIVELLTKQAAKADVPMVIPNSWWDQFPPDRRTLLHDACRFQAPLEVLDSMVDVYMSALSGLSQNENSRMYPNLFALATFEDK